MKSAIKSAATALVLSVITVGVASAMIPQTNLTKNRLPDEGMSSQVLSDIDSGKFNIGNDAAGSGLSELTDSSEPLTQNHHQLVGKHII